jgi:anti-anti-sigma factor
MRCTVTTRRFDRTAVVEVAGDLDLVAAPSLAAAIAIARIEHERIVVDLSRATFIDPSGLRELLGQGETTAAAGRSFALVPPEGDGARLFDVTGTRGAFTWLDGAPDHARFEPLPRRVGRHRTALAAIAERADAGVLADVARLVSDAVGDACVISTVDGAYLHACEAAHREREAEALLRRSVMAPVAWQGSEVLRRVVTTARPVVLGSGDPKPALAALPLGPPGHVLGVLGSSRDAPHHPYDTQDRVFLERAAQILSSEGDFAATARRA